MSNLVYKDGKRMEREIISISQKRQITIPQKYFEALGFDNEAECILRNNAIIIRPIYERDNGAFSEEVLEDLIHQGYSGEELLAKFKENSKKIRPAVHTMIREADNLAKYGGGETMSDIFGEEE